jgi:hemerythrin
MFEWKPEYSVSVSTLDLQHKKLFSLTNSLHQAMREGRERQVLADLLNELVSYTRTHFAAEEELLANCGYPTLNQHRSEHDSLLKQVATFQKAFAAGDAHLSIELMPFLQTWITSHILHLDTQYGDYLNKQGVY